MSVDPEQLIDEMLNWMLNMNLVRRVYRGLLICSILFLVKVGISPIGFRNWEQFWRNKGQLGLDGESLSIVDGRSDTNEKQVVDLVSKQVFEACPDFDVCDFLDVGELCKNASTWREGFFRRRYFSGVYDGRASKS